MTTVLLIRHGQSVTNVTQVFTGHYDVPLSPLGQEQARRTAAYLQKNFRIDAIYASDLMRAMQTAQPTAAAFGLPICPEPDLREICAGRWERMPFPLCRSSANTPSYTIAGGTISAAASARRAKA